MPGTLRRVLLDELVTVSAQVGSTRSRKAKIETLVASLRQLTPDETPVAVSYLAGRPVQDRLGVGYGAVHSVETVPAGLPSLQLLDVHRTLDEIAAAAGPGSKSTKARLLAVLMSAATRPEQVFLQRLILRNLRQGSLEGLMVDAVAAAVGVEPARVRRAAMMVGDLVAVAAAALVEGPRVLDRFQLEVMTPIQPMLAKTASDVAAALEMTGMVSVEWKLDGARIQVHRKGRRVAVFTRSLRDITDQVPTVVTVARQVSARSVILDGEALIMAAGRPAPFQDSMSGFTGGTTAKTGGVTPFFFDCLHLDGEDLVDMPATHRLAALDRAVPDQYRVARVHTGDPDRGTEFYEAAVDAGYEGVMVKSLDAPYQAGLRGGAWVKVKPAHTLDLVVLAAEWGSGRRSGWLSNLHLGARDGEGAGYVMLGKTFKGLTDDMLVWQTERFLKIESHRAGHVVFLRPEIVYEIAFDGVQRSTRYPGGLALRFARVKRYREDKSPQDADTIATVRDFHQERSV